MLAARSGSSRAVAAARRADSPAHGILQPRRGLHALQVLQAPQEVHRGVVQASQRRALGGQGPQLSGQALQVVRKLGE